MYYTFEKIYVASELWRVVSCFFYLGGLSFSLIIEVYLTYLILFNTESIVFGKEKLADYIMAIIFNATILLIISSCYDLYFLNKAFLLAMLCVSSELNKAVLGTIKGTIIIYDLFSKQYKLKKISNQQILQIQIQ